MWPAPEDMSVLPLNMGASDEDIREGKAQSPLKLRAGDGLLSTQASLLTIPARDFDAGESRVAAANLIAERAVTAAEQVKARQRAANEAGFDEEGQHMIPSKPRKSRRAALPPACFLLQLLNCRSLTRSSATQGMKERSHLFQPTQD